MRKDEAKTFLKMEKQDHPIHRHRLFEHRASSSRGKHEGESSFALCDRLGRTRDNSRAAPDGS